VPIKPSHDKKEKRIRREKKTGWLAQGWGSPRSKETEKATDNAAVVFFSPLGGKKADTHEQRMRSPYGGAKKKRRKTFLVYNSRESGIVQEGSNDGRLVVQYIVC